jgi:clan AA aspartic protease
MITGVVRSMEPLIRLTVKGARGRQLKIDALLDIGYTGLLTLPPDLIAELGLRWDSLGGATLADGSRCIFPVYEAKIVWDRRTIELVVDAVDGRPLVGMALMNGYELAAQLWEGGKVALRKRSPNG